MMPEKCCHSLITLPHMDVISTPTYRHHIWFGMQFQTKKNNLGTKSQHILRNISVYVCVIIDSIKYIFKYKPSSNLFGKKKIA